MLIIAFQERKNKENTLRGAKEMNLHVSIYEFAASAGALEGYVYHREEVDLKALPVWIGNLHRAYGLLPEHVLHGIQPSIDMTLGRAFRSLAPVLGENHEMLLKVRSMIRGALPESADDFQKNKWFQKESAEKGETSCS
jgi:hypothetical protein